MRTHARSLWLSSLLLLVAASALLGQPPGEAGLYVKAATWQESLTASWQRLTALEREEAEAAVATGPVTLGPWYVIGSFDNRDGKGFAQVYPPRT